MKSIGLLFNEGGSVPLRVPVDAIVSSREAQEAPGGRFSPEVQAKARDKRAVEAAVKQVSEAIKMPVRAVFSRNAGCGMCPCSPGFRLQIDEKGELSHRARLLLDRLRWAGRDRLYSGFVVRAKDGAVTAMQLPKTWAQVLEGARFWEREQALQVGR